MHRERKMGVMKMKRKKMLTFGELILSAYNACSPRQARCIVRFAVKAGVIVFRGKRRIMIS
jgi:hypothetical protein